MKRLLFVLIATMSTLCAHYERAAVKDFKLSVIVPCHWVHAKYLPEMMEAFCRQTYLPDEMVISLSMTESMTADEIEAVRALCQAQPFPVKLLEYPQRKLTGYNRTKCAKNATYPILVHNDADDLPHPRRLERIKWAFDHHDIEALVHSFTRDGDPAYEEKTIEPFIRRQLFKHKLHLGSVSFVASLLNDVPWRDTHPGREDKFFVRESDRRGHRIAILEENLLYYRNHLSSWGENSDG